MIKPEQIPDEVVEAARKAWLASDDGALNDWRNAISAAINSWPSGSSTKYTKEDCIILPVPQEKNDD